MEGYKIFFIFLVTIFTFVYGGRVQNPCKDGNIPCDNGECIHRFGWCDGKSQCSDQSDEKYCERRPFDVNPNDNCTDKHYACKDGMCIPISLRCDGERDCYGFYSPDEEDCDRDDSASTTTTQVTERYVYTSPLPTSTDFYDTRRTDESHNNNRQSVYNRSPSNNYDSYAPPPQVNHGYILFDPRYHGQNSNHRGSDVPFGGNFPSNQQPLTPEIPSDGRTYRTPTTTTSRQNPSRPGYPYVGRERPGVLAPRSILYPPRTTVSFSPRRPVRRSYYSPFYFAKNYTRDFGRKYRTNIRNAKDWLFGQRDESYGWGRDTPRGLIAFSLISNSFQSAVEDSELMRKGLQTHLGVKILRNQTGIEKMSTTRLAVYINALLATCQDPRDFWGIDLAKILQETQYELEQNQKFINPLIYLSLCLTNLPVNVAYLQQFLLSSFPTEISKDLHILATLAMACVAQQYPHDNHIRIKLDEAAQNLLSQMNRTDGSFGSKYSTALAAQALMSVNTSLNWDYQQTLDFLARQQINDGSFGNMQATYYAIPALSGRSLVHLRNTLCDPVDIDEEEPFIEDGPKKSVFYSLRMGYPEAFSTTIQLSVPERMNFFDIMRLAARQDPRFKFSYENSKGHYGVHTIANVPNDPERGLFWNLYQVPSSWDTVDLRARYVAGGVNELIPNDGDELIFWYLSEYLS